MKESELDKLEELLLSKHYTFKREWLEACVDYLESNGTKSMETLPNLIVHQFLNSEISKSYKPLMKIPEAAAKAVISKKMIFQITSFLNISESIYEQLSNATKHHDNLSWFHGNNTVLEEEEENENEKKNGKKKGMMRLELSDGVNNLHAFEISGPIFDFEHVLPGAKIILIDKVRCRKGFLFLDKSNCQLLGGHVEELQYNIVEKFSEILKIELDAEANRKKLALEMATEMRNTRKDRQQKTQSSISPFLVKMPRNGVKKGVVEDENSNLKSKSDEDDDIEVTLEVEKSSKPVENEKIVEEDVVVDEPRETWTFVNRFSSKPTTSAPKVTVQKLVPKPVKGAQMKDFNVFQNSKRKELPKSILEEEKRAPSPPAKPKIIEKAPEPDVEWYVPGKISEEEERSRKELGKWENLRVKTEVPDFNANNINNNVSEIIPPGFLGGGTTMGKELGKKKVVEHFVKDIHGPRGGAIVGGGENKKSEEHQKKQPEAEKEDDLITKFFPNVKSLKNRMSDTEKAPRLVQLGIVTPLQKSKIQIPVVEMVENEELEPEDERTPEKTKEIDWNSTIEVEGWKECERWGIGEAKRQRFEEGEEDILKNWNPEVGSYKLTRLMVGGMAGETRVMNLRQTEGVKAPHSFQQHQPQHRDEPIPQIAHALVRPRKSDIMYQQIPQNQPTTSKEAPKLAVEKRVSVIRKSENVQIYNTPLAQRIPSAENPIKFVDELSTRFERLHIVPLSEAIANRRFWMMSKIVAVLPTICYQMHELQSDGVDWQLKMRINDTSASNVVCMVSTDLLNRIFGFSVSQCKMLFDQQKMEELRVKKQEAERRLCGFKRLDLVMWLEISPQMEKFPLIVDVKTISDAMNVL